MPRGNTLRRMSRIGTMSFQAILEGVAAKSPAPGGGAVACATGALGAALAGMVVAYSWGKKSLADHQGALEQAAGALKEARGVLLQLADEDATAYAAVNELQRLPDTDPRRAAQMPAAADRAAQVPLAALAACSNLLRLLESLPPRTNRHLRSDLAIAALLAGAGARAAEWNVRVNTPLIADATRRAAVELASAGLAGDAAARAARVEAACA